MSEANTSTMPLNFQVNRVLLEDWLVPLFLIFLGLWSFVTNGLLLKLSSMIRKATSDKFVILQMSFFLAEVIFGFGTVISNIDRLRTLFLNDWYTTYYCMIITVCPFFGDLFSLTMICIMALERLIVISFPLQYRNSKKSRLSITLIFVAFSFSAIFTGICFYGVDNNVKPTVCTGTGARIIPLKPLLSYLKCAVGCLTVVFNLLVILKLYVKIKTKVTVLNGKDKVSFQREIKACKIVTFVVITCFAFAIFPNVLLTLLTSLSITNTSQIGPYVTLLGIFDSSVNIILYFWKDGKTREAFRAFMTKKRLLLDKASDQQTFATKAGTWELWNNNNALMELPCTATFRFFVVLILF